MSTETMATPDLSALDVSIRRRFAVDSVTRGSAWKAFSSRRFDFDFIAKDGSLAAEFAIDGELRIWRMPDYEHDPAAWGVLLSKELHGYDTDVELGVRCWFYRDEGMRLKNYGPYEVTLPAAVVSATLVKFGAYSDELRTAE